MARIASREVAVVEVETPAASPFAGSLLFEYVASYMYEDDTPAAERRAQALSLNRDLLRELLGQEELRDLIDPGALAAVEADLQGLSERARARGPDGLHDLLRRIGDLTADEVALRLAEPDRAAEITLALVAERRAVWIHLAGERRLIAAEDAGRYRDGLGRHAAQRRARRVPRAGARRAALARGALRPQPRAVPFRRPRRPLRARAAGRRAAARGPRGRRGGGARRAAARRGRAGVVRRRGGAAPAPGEPRGAAARDRAGRPARARALPAATGSAWTGRARRAARTPCATCSPGSRGWPCRPPSGRRRCFRAGWPTTRRRGSTSWRRAGEIVWVGAGAGGVGGGRVAIYFREDAPLLGPPAGRRRRPRDRWPTPCAQALAAGASFWDDLVAAAGGRRARGGVRRAVGPGLGGGGHERPLAAAAGAAPPAAGPAALGRRAPPPGRARGGARPRPSPGAGRCPRASSGARRPRPSAAAPWPS